MLQKLRPAFAFVLAALLCAQAPLAADDTTASGAPSDSQTTFVRFSSGNGSLDRAFRLAVGNLVMNTVPFKAGLLENERHVILAGLEYGQPWTRDAAINTWNGAGLLYPRVARDTLLSVLERRDGKVYIGGQYWDCIVWTVGAWSQYLYSGDKAFLSVAFDAVSNTLDHLEATEFDAELGLFRGAASSSDGVAGYPSVYREPGGFSGISEWPRHNPDRRHPVGFGVPMHALSTNCLYYRAYTLVQQMAAELERPADPHWSEQAATLKQSLNARFWREEAGQYRYLVDPFGDCDYAECLGHAYAVLFGVADEAQAQRILANQHIMPGGVPVLWPTFDRYRIPDFKENAESGFGRHSGCIWPPFEAIWATTAKQAGRADLFLSVLERTAEYACRDSQFVEMYHPLSGLPYGGLQEGRGNPQSKQDYEAADGTFLIGRWRPRVGQTWSATGYIRQILLGVLGMDFSTEGVTFAPVLPSGSTGVRLTHLPYRGMTLHIQVTGPGTRVTGFTVNGQPSPDPFLPADGIGDTDIAITLAE
jgi:glycogen debranching enzyme